MDSQPHKREHYRRDGTSKKALTKSQAKQATVHQKGLDRYKCRFCGHWHVGHSLRMHKREKSPVYQAQQQRKQRRRKQRMNEKQKKKKGRGRIVRLSDSGKCQRMRVMQSINHQHGLTYKEDPHSDETLRLFALGLAVETLEIRHILKTYHKGIPKENIYRQHPLKMGSYGSGHPDLIVVDGDVAWLYEIKSSQEAQAEHWQQLKAYAYWLERDPEFDGKTIVPRLYIAPRHGGLPREYPCEVSEFDMQGIHSLADEVISMAERRELPPRTCLTPREGEHKMCPLVSACFDTWKAVQMTEIKDKDLIVVFDRLAELYELREQYGAIDMVIKEIDLIEGSLLRVLKPKTTYQAGDVMLKYTKSESESKSYATAVKAGIDPRDEVKMREFTKPSVRTRFTVCRT